jgi:hypothetical protein
MTGHAFRFQCWNKRHASCVFWVTAASWIWTQTFCNLWSIWHACRMSVVLFPHTPDQNLPQVAVLLGELIGRYLNDWVMNVTIRRNNGVHEAESRLWCVNTL